jgi:tetratricopeptide (TPR) repeat protein
VWETAGRFHLARREAADAESAFLKAIELAPEFAQPYYQLGVLYISQKKLPEADAKLSKVVDKNDKNVGAHTLLGVVRNSLGKIDDANKQYRRALELSPKNALAANNLASNLSDFGGNLDEALKFAQVAREAAPEDPNVGDTLGWIYFRKGLFDNAYPLISDASKKLEKNAVVRYHHGMVLSKKGKAKEAAAELKAALALDAKFQGADEAKKELATLK